MADGFEAHLESSCQLVDVVAHALAGVEYHAHAEFVIQELRQLAVESADP